MIDIVYYMYMYNRGWGIMVGWMIDIREIIDIKLLRR